MKTPFWFILLLTAGVTITCDGSPADISAPVSRADTVGFAQTVLDAQAVLVVPPAEATLKNPFNPVAPPPVRVAGDDVVAPPSDYVLLQAIAAKITPDGSMKINGESFLVFGQKRFKMGDSLPILFEGNHYQIQLTRIKSTSFTLRLNAAEITRPIQSP